MKRHTPEEVLPKLRQAEADLAQVCQKLGVSEQTLHRWRNQYGGLKADEAKRLVAELALDKQMLQEVAPKNGDRRAEAAGGAAAAGGLRVSERRACRGAGDRADPAEEGKQPPQRWYGSPKQPHRHWRWLCRQNPAHRPRRNPQSL